MSKEEYLQSLQKNLIRMSTEEKEDAVRYYREYFDEAGPENEQKVIDELGSPVMLARKLSAECAVREENTHTGSNILTIILAICSFPVWFPLAIILAVLVFVLILLAFIFAFCFLITGAALVFSGVVGAIGGLVLLFSDFANALTSLGSGLALAGGGILLFVLSRFLTRKIVDAIVAAGRKKVKKMQRSG